jgi:hypothetical protein
MATLKPVIHGRDHEHGSADVVHIVYEKLGAGSAGTGAVGTLEFLIDGVGAPVTTGVKGDMRVDFACTVTGWALMADQAGSVVVDVWKDALINFPPTVADSITASAKPALAGADHASSTTLTGWVTTVNAGDVFRFNVSSAATVQRVTLALTLQRT